MDDELITKIKLLLNEAEAQSKIESIDSTLNDTMKRIEEIEKIHPFAITPPNKEGGRWQTSFKDSITGKRINLKAKSREELLQKLIPLYFPDKYLDKLTFEKLYREWLEYKKSITSSPNTILRHEQHYRKYFKETLENKKIKIMDTVFLEEFSNSLVNGNNLSKKEWVNVKTILNGMFDYAYRKGYISKNLMADVRIHVRFKQPKKKDGSTQTFSQKEKESLFKYLDKMWAETKDSSFLAVKANFYLGLRVGELVTLKWDDVQKYSIHISREEVLNQSSRTYLVVEHTKTYSERNVIAPKSVFNILSLIPKESEYIFTRAGKRITSRQINYVLEKYAERTGTQIKSSHKMRKTYASNLALNGVPLDAIREMLGHTDLRTTLGYIYNPLNEQDTYQLISKAL